MFFFSYSVLRHAPCDHVFLFLGMYHGIHVLFMYYFNKIQYFLFFYRTFTI